MTIMRFLTAPLLIACSSHGLMVPDVHLTRYAHALLSSSLSSNNDAPSNEMIRRDIEVMREEAKQRLQSLSLQMEEMQQKHSDEAIVHPESYSFLDASAFEKAEIPTVKVEKTQQKPPGDVLSPPTYVTDSTLLHGTRWKVVIQVGGARQTELQGEKPLLIHLVVDFLSDSGVDSVPARQRFFASRKAGLEPARGLKDDSEMSQ
jgi:hypothetical protein